MPFPVADVDAGATDGWATAFAGHREAALRLLAGFDDQCFAAARAARGRVGVRAFEAFRGALVRLLSRRRSRYAAELASIGAALRVPAPRLLFANVAYDLAAAAPMGLIPPPGCSTFVVTSGDAGPLHARNLDWHFPGTLLREHVLVLRVRGAAAGPWAAVGWPGLTGVLTAVAPGRFSVSVNFVKLRRNGFGHLLARAAAGATPVAWAVRDAVEHAGTFAEAVESLSTAPLLAPVLLTVAGVRSGEACVIERTPGRAALRRAPSVCVTNHYRSERLRGRSVDYDAGDTLVRLRAVEDGLAGDAPTDGDAALAVLAPAVRGHTQHQAIMRAVDGLLLVRVPGDAPSRVDAAPGTAASPR